jgi:hypothetical protein
VKSMVNRWRSSGCWLAWALRFVKSSAYSSCESKKKKVRVLCIIIPFLSLWYARL